MNKTFLTTMLSAALLFAGGQQADAASWRINSNANRHAHFTDINAAMSSNDVVAGDTLYLDPGCMITSTQNVTKRVTIIGTGFFLDGSVLGEAAVIGGLNIKASGTKVESIRLSKVTSGNQATTSIQANNVTLERCRYDHISVEGQYATIRQCCGYRIYGKGSTDMTSANCTIENCLIGTAGTVCVFDLFSPTIRNNYIYNEGTVYTFTYINSGIVINNLLLRSNNSALNNFFQNINNTTVTNNVMSCAEGTYASTYPDNIFLGALPAGTYYQRIPIDFNITDREVPLLKELAVLHGAATDGGDCGPFGGRYPYVLSGFPLGIPHFNSSVVGTRPQSGKVSVTQTVTIQKQ